MCFVLCSGSAYALNVDGFNVSTYFNVYNNGTGTSFDTFIETSSGPQLLYIVVDTVVSFDKGDVFDTEMIINYGECDNVNLEKVELLNTSWEVVGTVDGTLKNGIVTADNITAPRRLKAVRYTFCVTNPQYDIVDTGAYFVCLGQIWEFTEGQTWEQWIAANNTQANFPFYLSASAIGVMIEGTTYYLHDSSGYKEWNNEKIVNRGKYSAGDKWFAEVRANYIWQFSVENYTADKVSEGGLISSIIGWVKKIYNGIVEMPQKIVDGIGQKLTQLKDALLEGIKNLFIPNEEQIVDLRNKFEELLADRFGAVYESSKIVDDFYGAFSAEASINAVDGSNTVSFPTVTVNLVGVPFTFGGWEVDVVPEGFEGIIDVLKVITSIVCTFLFVNAMRKRLEGVLK